MTPPNAPAVTFANVAPMPLSRAVHDGDVTVRVRRIGPEVQVSAEIHSAERDSAATIALPRILPTTAVELARALLEAVTGQPVSLAQVLDEAAPQPAGEGAN